MADNQGRGLRAPAESAGDARWWVGMSAFDAADHIASRIDSLLAGVEDQETLDECQEVAGIWMRDLETIRAEQHAPEGRNPETAESSLAGVSGSPDETRPTIYLSGPISLGGSLSPDETTAFVDAFAAHAATLRAVGAHVINPCECERKDSWEDYMRLGISSVCVSDYVAVLPRWLESRGAILEVFVARQLGIPVVPAEEVAALANVGEHRPDQPQEKTLGSADKSARWTPPPASHYCAHGYVMPWAEHPAAGLETCPHGCTDDDTREARNPDPSAVREQEA